MAWLQSKLLKNSRTINFLTLHAKCSTGKPAPQTSSATSNMEGLNLITVGPMNKRLLVWTGKYRTAEEVPNQVSYSTISQCHSKCRIIFCNVMMVVAILGALYYINLGKRNAEQGLTLTQKNKERRKEYYEKYFPKQEEKEN